MLFKGHLYFVWIIILESLCCSLAYSLINMHPKLISSCLAYAPNTSNSTYQPGLHPVVLVFLNTKITTSWYSSITYIFPVRRICHSWVKKLLLLSGSTGLRKPSLLHTALSNPSPLILTTLALDAFYFLTGSLPLTPDSTMLLYYILKTTHLWILFPEVQSI